MSDAEQPTIEVTVNGAARPVPAGSSVADLIAAIKEGRATIVVHTTDSPAGELRGTLR